jgi:hypothetical protein
VDERLRETLWQRWEELGQQVNAFPRCRLTEEEIEKFLAINREQQDLLSQLMGR